MNLYETLAARLGPKGHIASADEQAPFLSEWRGKYPGVTPFIAMPADTAEIADIVRLCAEARTPITPQGGNTGLVGGQIPQGEVLLSLKRMNRIRAIDADNDSLVVEAGVVLAAVQQAAAESNRLFPLSLASEGSATVGGLISTNAGGVHVLRYGMMRDLVLGLEVVLADGRVLDGLKALRKDNTGYDLKQLFIGAEGTLGVVTAASLKLFPRPGAHETALIATASAEQALALLHRLKHETGAVSAFEIMNRLCVDLVVKNVPASRDPLPGAAFLVLAEFEAAAPEGLRASAESAVANALDAGEAHAAFFAENARQTREFWALRENASAAHKPEGPQVNHDVSVPVSRTPAFLATAGEAISAHTPGARIVAFGHMGDGNFHYTIIAPEGVSAERFDGEAMTQTIYDAVARLGGSISAEHGIGVARKQDLARYKDAASLELMRAIKRTLDPNAIMNPRVLL
jgi:FAD/FMN-containing dehydrogenase